MVFLVGCSDSLSRVERDCWYGQQGIAVDSLYNRETPIRIDRHEAIPKFFISVSANSDAATLGGMSHSQVNG